MKKLLVLMLVVVMAAVTIAQAPPMNDPCELVTYAMTSVGVNFFVGIIVSALVEYWPAWEGLSAKSKRPILLGMCMIVPVIGLAAGTYLCGLLWETWWWTAIVAGLSAFGGGTFAHIRKLP